MDAVSKSLARCNENPEFLERFYEIFLQSDRRIPPLFRDTDFSKQMGLLRNGLKLMLIFGYGGLNAKATVTRLGESHSRRGLNIDPSLYPLWIDSLIKAVKECDPQMTPDLEEEWRKHMAPGIAHMRSMY